MKNTIQEIGVSTTPAHQTQPQRIHSRAQTGMRIGLLTWVAALSAACVDDPGTFKPGKEVTVATATDAGSTETAGDAGAPDASSPDISAETSGSTDASISEAAAPDANQPIDTGITPDIKADVSAAADTQSTGADDDTVDTSAPVPTPDAKADAQKSDTTPDVKQYKPAPADQMMSKFVPGMELPVQQVLVVTKGKVYEAFEGFGHKPGLTPWSNNFVKSVNGADVYTLKMGDLPLDLAVAGKGNFRVVSIKLPAGTKAGTYVDSLTGKKAQDGVTPIYDRAPILPVLCDGAEYSADDAKLLAEAMIMTGKMEFNDNLQMMRDTYLYKLQQTINLIFANAGKSYAPQCSVQLVTPGDVKVVDGQDCPQGCLYAMVTIQPIASWTELIQKQ